MLTIPLQSSNIAHSLASSSADRRPEYASCRSDLEWRPGASDAHAANYMFCPNQKLDTYNTYNFLHKRNISVSWVISAIQSVRYSNPK
jgi:hypothetical protein